MMFSLCSCHFKCSKSCLFHSLRLVTTSDIFSFVFLFGLNFFLSPKVVQTKKHKLFLSFPSKLKKKTILEGALASIRATFRLQFPPPLPSTSQFSQEGRKTKYIKEKLERTVAALNPLQSR